LLWSNEAGCHAFVLWQLAHSVENPEAAWLGFWVAWYLAWWHPTQSVVVPVYLPPTWHLAQSTFWWAPVRGKRVLPWSVKVAGRQPVSRWQAAHSVGKPPERWSGFLVLLKACRWHEAQSRGVPLNLEA
jgi:hypothetical protein